MKRQNTLYGFFYAIFLLLPLACSLNGDGQRCSFVSGCDGGGDGEVMTFSSSNFSCTVQPESYSVPVREYFNATLAAEGGTGPYFVEVRGVPQSFSSSTIIRGGYTTTGQKSEYVEIYDSAGNQTSCLLQVDVVSGQGCEISVADGNYSPAAGASVPFKFRAWGVSSTTPVTYQFKPDVHASTSTGYVLTKNGGTASFNYSYDTKGNKRPTLYVSTSNRFDSCQIHTLHVREPDFEISGSRLSKVDGTGTNDAIELEMIDNGDFAGNLSYSYELSFANELTELVPDGNTVRIESATEEYQKLELTVTATSDEGDSVQKTAILHFAPTSLCHLKLSGAGQNNRAVLGDTLQYEVDTTPGNGESVVIKSLSHAEDAEVLSSVSSEGVYANPIEVKYHELGTKSLSVTAFTSPSNAVCVDAAGNFPSLDVEMTRPAQCLAGAAPSAQNVGHNIDIHVKVEEGSGIGPYFVRDITSVAGAGLELQAASTASTFSGSEIGHRNVQFNSGRPAPGILYPVYVEVEDLGDPNGRRFNCTTTARSVLPVSAAMCTAHFERGGTKVTHARSRDNLKLVVNANYADSTHARYLSNGILSAEYMGWVQLPHVEHIRYNDSANDNSSVAWRNADLKVRTAYGNLEKQCVANLNISPALSCTLDFPTLPHSSNGVAGNTIVITSETTFPGNKTLEPLGNKQVDFTANISRGVHKVYNHFDDKSGNGIEKVVTRNLTGSGNATQVLTGRYTRHGRYAKVKNHVKDKYDPTGAVCEANKFMYAHLMRTALVYDVNEDWDAIPLPSNASCHIRATNISKASDPDNSKATIWLFGYEKGYHNATKLRNRDCHNLYSIHKGGNHPTSCTRSFVPKAGSDHCELQAKALGWHANYNNPGDWRIEVWAEDSNGDILGQVYRLPDILQKR